MVAMGGNWPMKEGVHRLNVAVCRRCAGIGPCTWQWPSQTVGKGDISVPW